MDNKPLWLRFILDKIGIRNIIVFILGIPAMITLITKAWNALGTNTHIVVIVCGSIILLCIVLFIYDRMRKHLHDIPILLKRMNDIIQEKALNLNTNNFSPEHFEKFANLTNLDIDEITSIAKASFPNIDLLVDNMPKINQITKEATDALNQDMLNSQRVREFIFEITGLEASLENDSNYQYLKKKLDKIKIPSKNLGTAILKYQDTSLQYGTMLPLILATNRKELEKLMGLTLILDSKLKRKEYEKQLKDSMTEITELIDKYYKGEHYVQKKD